MQQIVLSDRQCYFIRQNLLPVKNTLFRTIQVNIKQLEKLESHQFLLNIYPYEGGTNIKFKYLMDKLNDTLIKKIGGHSIPVTFMQKNHSN